MSVIRGVDVGFGNTKYVAARTPSEIHCHSFPSVISQADPKGGLNVGVGGHANTVVLTVKGISYEVGKDITKVMGPDSVRPLSVDFSKTEDHLALLRGAMFYMDQPTIHMLVLGLPVNRYREQVAALTEMVKGEHKIPSTRTQKAMTVTVERVLVIPQPMGSYVSYANEHRIYDKWNKQRNLVIDVGYRTLDWLYLDKGSPNVNRSGALDSGMSAVIRRLATEIEAKDKTAAPDFFRLEEALQNGGLTSVFGKEYDISDFIPKVQSYALRSLSAMTGGSSANEIGNISEIDNILLTGGGAQFFLPLVKKKFPKHDVHVVEDSLYGNVKGYQIAGEVRLPSQAAA